MIKQTGQEEKGKKKVLHREKKPYMKPQLTEYGHVEKLTQSAGTGNAEGHGLKRP
jgi:hypothetical protein